MQIERNFKGVYAQNEMKENKKHFTEARNKAAERAKKDILEHYEKAEIREKAAVSCVTLGADIVKALDGLRGVPISREEFALIADNVADKGYWVQSKLRQVAEENGILLAPGLPPTYTERIQALETAKDRMLSFIERADIDGLNADITDKAFRRLESEFKGGYRKYQMNAEKQAAFLLDQAKNCGDFFSVAVFVKNALETAPDDVKAEIIKKVSADNSYWNSVREYGLKAAMEEIKTKERQSEKAVLPLVADARIAKDVAKLTEAERNAALYGSGITQDNNPRKIDKQGLEFLKTDEGRDMVKRFEKVNKDFAELQADKAAEAEKRAEIMES